MCVNEANFGISKIKNPDIVLVHKKNFNNIIFRRLAKRPEKNFFNIDDNEVKFGVAKSDSYIYFKPNGAVYTMVKKNDPIKIYQIGNGCFVYTQISYGGIKKENIKFTDNIVFNLAKHPLKFTQRNFIKELFNCLDKPYGACEIGKTDCASYIANSLAKFGVFVPQLADHMTYALTKKPIEKAVAGDILYMEGHVMVYLGKHKNDIYVINNLHSYYDKNAMLIYPLKVCVTNINEAYRKNGTKGFENIECALSYS